MKSTCPERKFAAFLETQKKNETAWFLVSVLIQGIFFLPMSVIFIFSFNAPAYIVGLTLSLFFANIIAGLSGAGIKVIVYLLAASIALHAILLAIFTL